MICVRNPRGGTLFVPDKIVHFESWRVNLIAARPTGVARGRTRFGSGVRRRLRLADQWCGPQGHSAGPSGPTSEGRVHPVAARPARVSVYLGATLTS